MPDADAPTLPDPIATLAWQSRRAVGAPWRLFVAALVDTLEGGMDAEGRDEALRRLGARMAQLTPLPACATLLDLESRINDALAAMDWGHAGLFLDAPARVLVLRHWGAPLVATARLPGGEWIVPVLEGLHGGWIAAQSGLPVPPRLRRLSAEPGLVTLRTV